MDTPRDRRRVQWEAVEQGLFDVAVVGGGINGASIYHRLCAEGYRALLVEQADFAAGTSQASAMFIWGGLLYLRNLEFRSVAKFCSSRDQMIREMAEWVRVCPMRYMPSREDSRGPAFILAGLWLYWLLSGFRRRRPRVEGRYPERELLKTDRLFRSLAYEEAGVVPSDARFVLQWVLPHRDAHRVALNYCGLHGGGYDRADRAWQLEVVDGLLGREGVARARLVVNAAGGWTDRINRRFGVASAYKHVFGKGVFIGIPRDPRLSSALIFETREEADCMSLIPWGPIALWGPTETLTDDLEAGYQIEPRDIHLLLDELNRHVVRPVAVSDIVSLRCGVRPLAVERSFQSGRHTLGLSRNSHIERDQDVPWISVYGGKITGCIPAACAVARHVREALGLAAGPRPAAAAEPPPPTWQRFPGLREPGPSARYCAEHEMCWTLEDYLRRRTNIAQWVARGGLGRRDENLPRLLDLAAVFTGGDRAAAQAAVDAYRQRVRRDFDEVLARCEMRRAA